MGEVAGCSSELFLRADAPLEADGFVERVTEPVFGGQLPAALPAEARAASVPRPSVLVDPTNEFSHVLHLSTCLSRSQALCADCKGC